ncbi:hypothetical protein PPL_01716 [Heterostelium album PN500]|uniref:IPT/TIG domain-containing protein n=1 Tax=Heterostelium pallidum (strain ATCC 26659 / Pp 5 / PN500) TaxID=670386 RepID=D3B0A0_HETP5|nr:hypothetical protein PPL_01716 [Heterostelium album PN500]EFA84724.1 hypothetical protein PPL_01716 [Heterostelium album PN500]|eukprot:XP_020436836.1 hypothetical protein PPL_01716 [Heterostelium album PN500]
MESTYQITLLFRFILLLIQYNGYIINAITIDYMSPLRGYLDGGNIFKINCAEFPSTPILTVTSLDGTNEAIFTLNSEFISYYEWVVPSSPAMKSGKRKRTESAVFRMKFTGDPGYYMESTFIYVSPEIVSFSPSYYYSGANGKKLEIDGIDLIIDKDDIPTVYIGRQQCTVIQKKPNNIQCIIPTWPKPASVTISVSLHGTVTEANSLFSYILPAIESIYPGRIASGASKNIIIKGDIVDNAGLPTSIVTIGGKSCTDIKFDEIMSEISCNTPVFDIKEGTHTYYDIQVSVNGVDITYPVIESITPDVGIASGTTDVVIGGSYLDDVSEVFFGTQQCKVYKTITSTSFTCEAQPFTLEMGETHRSLDIQVYIGGGTFKPEGGAKFIYYIPVITSINPTRLLAGVVSKLTIIGDGFFDGLSVIIQGNTFERDSINKDPTTIYTEINTNLLSVGRQSLRVSSSGGDTPEVDIFIVEPSISSVDTLRGYLNTYTPIVIKTSDIPTTYLDYPESILSFKIGNQFCLYLMVTDTDEYSCTVPPGVTVGSEYISIIYKNTEYITNTQFTYFVPDVTGQSQSSNIPLGGGQLVIDGTDLDVVSYVLIDNVRIDPTNCMIGSTRISCTIPRHSPGSFAVDMVVHTLKADFTHSTGTNIAYQGPSITQVSPSQGSKLQPNTITLTGVGFGNNINLIAINVGTQACINIVIIIANSKIQCDIPAMDPGVYQVVASIRPNTATLIGVESVNDITYRSYSLSCLGRPNPDGTNSPVDWWFIYKLSNKMNANPNEYLYMDANSERLERYPDLQQSAANSLSPLESTFLQYNHYNYMFFNDQPGNRKSTGERDLSRKVYVHGHFKGMTMFEDPDLTFNINGIHIQHSNPYFPSYTSPTATDYNEPSDGLIFLGLPDFNQYFFCYSFANFDNVMEYISKNDGNLLDSYRVPPLSTWTNNERNRYPFFYDYMAYWITLPDRVPNVGIDPPVKSQHDFSEECRSVVTSQTAIENICWWRSPVPIPIGNINLIYFMKTSINTPRPKFISATATRPLTYSKYIMLGGKNTPKYDGPDLWMIVADCFQKKLFIEMFYAIGQRQMIPNEQVMNVGLMELPQYLARAGPYSSYKLIGSKNEHAKIGFPMYPEYDNPFAANENYFCVGDSNRHSGQGKRGGGAICFQHPTLVYQFNRMVRTYNTFLSPNLISKFGETINLFSTIDQPIKVNRPATWTNNILVEVKDAINGNLYSKNPRYFESITPLTFVNPHDVVLLIQSLRTSRANVVPVTEISVVPTVQTMPEQDIMYYVSNDILSLHYVAFDQAIGSICNYNPMITECTRNVARTQTIARVAVPLVAPDFPSAYNQPYGNMMTTRGYDLATNVDFHIIRFIDRFMALLPNARRNFYPIFINTALISARFDTNIGIIRRSSDMCGEEIAYFMTLQYIYYQSGFTNENDLTYKVGINDPNWSNDISFNENFNPCMSNLFDNFPNIDTYSDDENMDTPTQDQLVRRSAAAAWDWMKQSYSNGRGGSTDRVDNSEQIPVNVLMQVLIDVKQIGFNSMSDLRRYFSKSYASNINFNDILYNNFIIKRPVIISDTDMLLITMMFPNSLMRPITTTLEDSSEDINESIQNPLFINERMVKSGVQQLFSAISSMTFPTMNQSSIIAMTSYQFERLELAIDKWLTINNQSSAIQTLILDPQHQYRNQPIKFIDELNRDQSGNSIDLDVKTTTSGNRVALSTPLSISSITFILESILVSKAKSKKFGDLEIFYLSKPDDYNGEISHDYDGMVIATLNSLLCDIRMISESDFLSDQFDSLCIGIGPIITSVDQNTGSTSGGFIITINGLRFNSSLSISIGENQCLTCELISVNQITCQVPSGSGLNNQILLSTSQTIFNLQRTKFLFSYNNPTIELVEPKIIDSVGGDILTISGSNFGNDLTNIKVLIDDRLSCWPIYSISHQSITCQTPSAIGEYRSISVIVNGQSTKQTIENLDIQTFGYTGPNIVAVIPESGDPMDTIVVLGYGLGSVQDSDLPPVLYIGDSQIQLDNFTGDGIEFLLDYETSTQPMTVQVGDQSFNSEFTYYQPIISLFNNSKIGTSGGLIQLDGFGFGLSSSDINSLFNGKEIECNPFDQFIECEIPPGIGTNYQLSISVSDQSIDFSDINNTISYLPPTITGYSIFDTNKIRILGNNFVPEGVLFDTETSYININLNDETEEICTSFISDQMIECQFIYIPTSIQVFVDGQNSNIINLN